MNNIIPRFIADKYHRGIFKGRMKNAVMFADISGFTALTETLADRGKEGAEILSGIINEVFSPCIEFVYRRRGFITHFAGDSFMAVFEIDCMDALLSAVDINNEFKRQHVKNTRFGDFKISVKIGISQGNIDWGITGSGNERTYYFRGKAVEGCAKAEKQCGVGDIMIDKHIYLNAKDSISIKRYSDDYYKLLAVNYKRDYYDLPADDIDDNLLKLFVPAVIIDSRPVDELRDIVSIFLSLREIDREFESLDYFSSNLKKLVKKWGGYFSRISFGDKGCTGLINFGIPLSYENNISRALNCINEIRYFYGDKIRAGITFGRLFAGFIGSSIRSAYDVLGDAVNLSARIAMEAGWGDIWISQGIADSAKLHFDTDFAGEFQFSGKKERVPVYKLKDKKSVADKFYSGNIYGRYNEIASIRESVSPIFDKRFAGILYIYGEAGIGKSRLVHEALKPLRERVRLCYLQCDSMIKKAWNPFIYYMEDYFQQNSNISFKENEIFFEENFIHMVNILRGLKLKGSAEIIKELIRTKSFIKALLSLDTTDTLYEKLDAKQRHENTIYAVKNFFKALSLIRPIIILIEDIHWADNESTQMMEPFTRNIDDFSMIILCTGRYNDDGSKPIFPVMHKIPEKEIELNCPANEPSKEIIQDNLGSPPDEKLLKFIMKKTSNNPFFIEQFCLYMKEHGLIRKKGNYCSADTETFDIPAGINQILIARIDRLSREIKELAKIASVFGREFRSDMLHKSVELLYQRISNYDNPDKSMFDILSIENILKSSNNYLMEGKNDNLWDSLDEIRYVFRHSLLYESAYDMQLRERLRILHHTTASAIEDLYNMDHNKKEYLNDLAYHFEKAEIRDKAEEYLEKAGNYLKKTYKNMKAIEKFERLLNYISNTEKIAEINLVIGDIYTLTGKWDKAQETYGRCIQISEKIGNKDLIALSYNVYGNTHLSMGNTEEAIKYFRKARDIYVNINNKKGTGESEYYLGQAYFSLGDYTKALEHYETKRIISQEIFDQRGIAIATGEIGLIFYISGKISKALDNYKISSKILENSGDKRGLGTAMLNMGLAYSDMGQYSKALECYDIKRNISEEIGDKHGISISAGNTGLVYYKLGEYQKALEYFLLKKKLSEEIGDHMGMGIANANIGNIYYNMGRFEESLECYKIFQYVCQKAGKRKQISEAMGRIGLVYKSLRKYKEALECFDSQKATAEEIGYQRGIGMAEGYRGLLFTAVGNYQEAIKCFKGYLEIAQEIGDNWGIIQANVGMGDVYILSGEYLQAIDSYRYCIEISEAIEDYKHIAIATGTLGKIYSAMEEYEKALESFDRSIKIFKEKGFGSSDLILCLLANAETYLSLNNIKEARRLNEEAMQIALDINNDELMEKINNQKLAIESQ